MTRTNADEPEVSPPPMPAASRLAGALWLAAGGAFFLLCVVLVAGAVWEGINQETGAAYFVYAPLLIVIFYGGPGLYFTCAGRPTMKGTARDITAPAYVSFACSALILMCRTLPLLMSLALPDRGKPIHLVAVYLFEFLLAGLLTAAGILAMASRPAYVKWYRHRYHIEKPKLAAANDWQENPPLATAVDSDPDFDFAKQ